MDMFDELRKQIMNGADAEDLGKRLAKVMNEASAEKKKKDQEAEDKKAKETDLNKYAKQIVEALYNYVKVAAPATAAKIPADALDEKMMRMTLDIMLPELVDVLGGDTEDIPFDEDPITRFLKENHLA